MPFSDKSKPEAVENPLIVLGLAETGGNISDEDLRRRYMELARENPPERNQEAFRRIRGAYEALRRAGDRIRWALKMPEPPPDRFTPKAGWPPGPMGVSPAWWLASDPWSELGKRDFAADCRQPKENVRQLLLFDTTKTKSQKDA